jgi:thiol-disulfide isomerase/thioredoxin
MLKKTILILILAMQVAYSQQTISGKMIPVSDDFGWIALYQLKGAKQLFVESVIIENGTFSFEIPENTPSGMYRLLYKLDSGGAIDIIYTNENIDLNFNAENPFETLEVLSSEENKIYVSYLKEINKLKAEIDKLQYSYFTLETAQEKEAYASLYQFKLNEFKNLQTEFEQNSEGMLASHFIKANNKYYAESLILTPQEYLNSEKKHYFDFIDFSDSELLNSAFISESVLNYVLYLSVSEDVEVQNALYKNAINEVMHQIGDNVVLKSEIITTLMYTFAKAENIIILDFIIADFYVKLPSEVQNHEDLYKILDLVKFAIGQKAPDFSWEENNETKSLYSLNDSEIYLLVFWSSSCSHCVDAIPKLYEFTKNNTAIHVIDIALEDSSTEFNKYAKKFTQWTNVLGLGKWENPIAKSYEIVSTPTYFILDTDKNIIAKPEFLEDVKMFFEN